MDPLDYVLLAELNKAKTTFDPLKFKGLYSSGSSYGVGDLVQIEGDYYKAIQPLAPGVGFNGFNRMQYVMAVGNDSVSSSISSNTNLTFSTLSAGDIRANDVIVYSVTTDNTSLNGTHAITAYGLSPGSMSTGMATTHVAGQSWSGGSGQVAILRVPSNYDHVANASYSLGLSVPTTLRYPNYGARVYRHIDSYNVAEARTVSFSNTVPLTSATAGGTVQDKGRFEVNIAQYTINTSVDNPWANLAAGALNPSFYPPSANEQDYSPNYGYHKEVDGGTTYLAPGSGNPDYPSWNGSLLQLNLYGRTTSTPPLSPIYWTKLDLLGRLANSGSSQIFDAGGTWSKPAGAVRCRITMVGGGGGGTRGGSNGRAGSGGGWLDIELAADELPNALTVSVGAGGIGSSTTAGNGGNSTVSGTLSSGGTFSAIAYGGGGGGQTLNVGGGSSINGQTIGRSPTANVSSEVPSNNHQRGGSGSTANQFTEYIFASGPGCGGQDVTVKPQYYGSNGLVKPGADGDLTKVLFGGGGLGATGFSNDLAKNGGKYGGGGGHVSQTSVGGNGGQGGVCITTYFN